VILLGSDYYESLESIIEHEKAGQPRIGIGSNCRIENTIVDKNARIGNNVVISPAGKPEKVDHLNYYIRDGIVIIPKKRRDPPWHGDLRVAFTCKRLSGKTFAC
jgi:glucose-1-phosphate adenylyltransferase